jgi:hypothetical protein
VNCLRGSQVLIAALPQRAVISRQSLKLPLEGLHTLPKDLCLMPKGIGYCKKG